MESEYTCSINGTSREWGLITKGDGTNKWMKFNLQLKVLML
jgi:hypothetical protein